MTYILNDIHYKICDYFDEDILGLNYNIYEDSILCHIYDDKLVVNILEYYITKDLEFLNIDNLDEATLIFNHLCCIEGDILNIINSDKFKDKNYPKSSIDDYDDDDIQKEMINNNIIFYKNKLFTNKIYDILFDDEKINILESKFYLNAVHCRNMKNIMDCTYEYQIVYIYNYDSTYKNYNKYDDGKGEDAWYSTDEDYHLLYHGEDGWAETWGEKHDNFHKNILKYIYDKKLTVHINIIANLQIPLKKDMLSINTVSLYFDDHVSSKISKGAIPESVETIQFLYDYRGHGCKYIKKGFLPENLKTLIIGNYITRSDDYLPKKLENLKIYKGNILINKGFIPNSIKRLVISDYISGNISHDAIPESILYFYGGNKWIKNNSIVKVNNYEETLIPKKINVYSPYR
jgi:hypothetical protein